MATKVPFLTTAYGGYSHREIPREDEELTHVGPGTPCGEYCRRFWQPIVFFRELNDLPVRVRVLGEDLVVFRDRRGRVGLMELHCCHRGTSLEFGVVSEQGIRCCYHGWLFDIDGKILEIVVSDDIFIGSGIPTVIVFQTGEGLVREPFFTCKVLCAGIYGNGNHPGSFKDTLLIVSLTGRLAQRTLYPEYRTASMEAKGQRNTWVW